jgi:hypothetical protein
MGEIQSTRQNLSKKRNKQQRKQNLSRNLLPQFLPSLTELRQPRNTTRLSGITRMLTNILLSPNYFVIIIIFLALETMPNM